MGKVANLIKVGLSKKNGETHPFGISNLDYEMPGNLEAKQADMLRAADPSRVTAQTAYNTGSLAKIKQNQLVVYTAVMKAKLETARAIGGMVSVQNNFKVGIANQNLQNTISNAQTMEQLAKADFSTNMVGIPAAAGISWLTASSQRSKQLID